jgi:hypothetical protein
LKVEGHRTLASRVHQYYLAANVLKHGGGKSFRELSGMEGQPFTLQDEEGKALIDVTADGFLPGLVRTLREAYGVLQAK